MPRDVRARGLSAAIAPVLVPDLDEETAWGAEVERPGSVELPGRLHVEPIGLQALMDLVHPLPALLHEADVERAGIFDFGRLPEIVQSQDEPGFVDQHGE